MQKSLLVIEKMNYKLIKISPHITSSSIFILHNEFKSPTQIEFVYLSFQGRLFTLAQHLKLN